jgi:hypothetical protein
LGRLVREGRFFCPGINVRLCLDRLVRHERVVGRRIDAFPAVNDEIV